MAASGNDSLPSEPPPVPDAGPALPMAAPIVEAAWSPEFVAQALEVFCVCLGPEGLMHLRPVHAPSLRLPMGVEREPAELVLAAVARYDLAPIVVHSTSWRSEPGRVILSYVAAVEVPGSPSPFLAAEPVTRVELARGERTSAPASIAVRQVLEHALRHLSWLVREDPAVRAALAAWRPSLEPYVPEPFQNL